MDDLKSTGNVSNVFPDKGTPIDLTPKTGYCEKPYINVSDVKINDDDVRRIIVKMGNAIREETFPKVNNGDAMIKIINEYNKLVNIFFRD